MAMKYTKEQLDTLDKDLLIQLFHGLPSGLRCIPIKGNGDLPDLSIDLHTVNKPISAGW